VRLDGARGGQDVNAGDISPGPWLRALLFLPGTAYAALVRLRNALYDAGLLPVRRLPGPVIAFGNLTVGGTGKTPLTSYAAASLADSGYRVGVIGRGYRRRGGRAPLLVSDGRSLLVDAPRSGDEAYLVARDNPSVAVAVGADRVGAASLLMKAGTAEVFLLDDAFQHRGVWRDLNLLVVDGRDPWGNGRMLPFGPLREPVSAVTRADAIVVTRGDGSCPNALGSILEQRNPGAPVFHARLAARRFVRADGEPVDLAALKGLAAYAFSGIARPERFEEELDGLGVRRAGTRRFPDHHPYRPRDLEALGAEARRCGAEVLVTTEKDLVRIAAPPDGGPALFALALGISFAPGSDLTGFLLDRLRDRAPQARSGSRP